nr:hypothetical protein [Tanacetum cinerariifolium]
MIFNIESMMKHSYSNDDTCFSIDEILEEDFDALLDEGSKILLSIKGTLLEEEIFSKFDKFVAMTADENSKSKSDNHEPPFEKITISTDYKIKTSLEEPPTDLKLKPLFDNLEYVFLEEPSFLPVIISSKLYAKNKNKLVSVLKKHKEAFSCKTTNILDSLWVSPIHCVPKKGSITVVTNKNDELVPTRIVTGWRVCIDYRKLNEATTKDHFPLQFMDQMRMPFGLCNAPATFQRRMLAIFHDMIEESVEVFMDDFFVYGNSFDKCLKNLDKCSNIVKMLILSLTGKNFTSWSKKELWLDTRPLTMLLGKDTSFEFNDECQKAFELLKEKLTYAPVIVSLNWNLSFELMCDANDFAVEAVLERLLLKKKKKEATVVNVEKETYAGDKVQVRFSTLVSIDTKRVEGEGSKARLDTQELKNLVDSGKTLKDTRLNDEFILDDKDLEGKIDETGQYRIQLTESQIVVVPEVIMTESTGLDQHGSTWVEYMLITPEETLTSMVIPEGKTELISFVSVASEIPLDVHAPAFEFQKDFYNSRKASITREDVFSNSKIMTMKYVEIENSNRGNEFLGINEVFKVRDGAIELIKRELEIMIKAKKHYISVAAQQSGDDAPINGRSINEGEAAAERISNDSEEIARVLTSMDAATVLAGGIDVPTGSGSIPTDGPPATDISTGSEVAPTTSPIVTASPIVTSYSRRKGKEVMVESDTPKKQKLQEQIDA